MFSRRKGKGGKKKRTACGGWVGKRGREEGKKKKAKFNANTGKRGEVASARVPERGGRKEPLSVRADVLRRERKTTRRRRTREGGGSQRKKKKKREGIAV